MPKIGESLIERASEFINKRHFGQLRASGEPYVKHLFEVYRILKSLNLDEETLAAGLLHDTLEDTKTTFEELESLFGSNVAKIVLGVTKLTKLDGKDIRSYQVENYRRFILASLEDIRVIFVKLADRLHNMRTLEFLPHEKRIRIARETLDIYAPIANRLGLSTIKNELEDLSFKYLYPEEYKKVRAFAAKAHRELREYLKKHLLPSLHKSLKENNLDAKVFYRSKHLYSIWQKTIKKGIPLEEVHDILGVRIIVPKVSDCYMALGIVHGLFKPVPGRFDDYISLPKPNLYQSLHTTVFGPGGRMVEFQIRTFEMHEIATRGVAAHWAYKESTSQQNVYSWLSRLVESIQGNENSSELLENLRLELFSDEVFVFTPKGDLLVLPSGSTPVDFAYAIHTEVGHTCAGAKVNGKLVPLDYKLQNGDVVEIMTKPNRSPSLQWLEFVKTSRAISKIKAFIRQKERQERELLYKQDLYVYASRLGYTPEELEKELINALSIKKDQLILILSRLGFEKIKSLLKGPKTQKPQSDWTESLSLDGLEIMHTLADCCNPLPGEEVFGVITKGRGLSVHSSKCPNLKHIMKVSPEKVLKLSWRFSKGLHPVKLRVIAFDRVGLLSEVTKTISSFGANITKASTNSLSSGEAIMDFTIQVDNYQSFKRILEALNQLQGVKQSLRLMG
ncbi:MAG: bifunctional (p)ppGpp synthetase/guanosine-3',5'-bis(diphosphate) 3'-pyrophosphohydrolase [Aquificaceae bacterium]